MPKRPTGAESRTKAGLIQVSTDLPTEIADLVRQAAALSEHRSVRQFAARAIVLAAEQVLFTEGLHEKKEKLEKFLISH